MLHAQAVACCIAETCAHRNLQKTGAEKTKEGGTIPCSSTCRRWLVGQVPKVKGEVESACLCGGVESCMLLAAAAIGVHGVSCG